MSTLSYRIEKNPNPASAERVAEVHANPGFGKFFTDHMLSITWNASDGWHDARIEPYGPIAMDPATSVLHYAQEIFEGMKAYRYPDDSIWTFRPEANAARFNRSAKRLALPQIPEDIFVESLEQLVRIDARWVPGGGEQSLYLRPFMYGSEVFLGVRPSTEARYMVIASPVGAYFAGGVKPVKIWVSSNYTRAARGGTGEAKCGGNYAGGLAAQIEASEQGCDQVCFLDAAEHKWVEELGGMNVYFVFADGRLVTPPLGTILEGITRASILELAKEIGLQPEERHISIDEWMQGWESGEIKEVFACGTAAVVTPIGRVITEQGSAGNDTAGEMTMRIRKSLIDVQYGSAADTHKWMRRLA
jgi:branched-chain amino acid aminotransferase